MNKPDILNAFGLLNTEGYEVTLREAEIFVWLIRGKKNREIAALLCIAYPTARTHRQNIYTKMKVNSKYGLTKIAEKLGIA